MKTSVEWLREYADVNVDVKTLADRLTMTGSKVETIEQKGDNIKNVVVGKILEITKHPDADKLIVTKVDVGTETVQIVTGANNVKVGDLVPIAKDGSELPGDVKIKTGKLRGVESCGMMCAVTELGLDLADYPGQIEHGIMILPKDYEKFLGKDIVEVLNLKEDILDFEITSNRPDCFSIEGLGRETAIALNENFRNPHKDLNKEVKTVESIEGLKVDVEAKDLCYRYIARVLKDVKIEPSPEWMKRRLKACGVRAINNIVDITNYVMLELGQPMHAFDIENVAGKHIIVRRAKENEKITTLDEIERTLNTDNLVIADEEKPVAVAGVMGGANSGITDETKIVVFEAATFNRGSVRLTAKKLGLRTESSSRFEKGLSPEIAIRAINRAVELAELIGAGKAVEEKIDIYPEKEPQKVIPFEPEKVNKLLGMNISSEEMVDILTKLGINVKGDKLEIPFFRVDLNLTADIAEEIIRIHGYNTLNSTLINAESTVGAKTKVQKLQDRVKDLLVEKGFSEMYAFSFIGHKDFEKCKLDSQKAIKITNPLGEEFSLMRTSMMPTVMQSISTNYNKKNKDVALFEIGKTYTDENGNIAKGEVATETEQIAFALYGKNADFYVVKGIIENILQISNIAKYQLARETEVNLHPGRSAKILIGKDRIASFGEVHPEVLENYGIGEKVYYAVIDIEKFAKYGKNNKKYTPIPKYPAVERDIALVVDEDVEVGQIESVISKKAKNILERAELFDVYRSDKLGENKKSVAYELIFRAQDRTLTDDEIKNTMEAITKELQTILGAELRA
jgi:phenylalanyl-tRNA synthetase beta chain